MSKYIKVRGQLYREVDSSKDTLLSLSTEAHSLSKLAEVAREKQSTSVEESFVFFEKRYKGLLERVNTLAKAAARELTKEVKESRKSAGTK